MRSFFALGVVALAGLSAAQDPYNIDPQSVDQPLRDYWCQQQKTQCPFICTQQDNVETLSTVSNDCDADSLAYLCVCDNGISPNLTEFSQTIPYFKCTEWGNQCVKGCNGDNTCADKCRADHPCGAQVPITPNNTGSAIPSSTPSETGSPSASTATDGSAPTSSSADWGTGAASAMLDLGASYSMAILFVSVFAGFAILL
ncbi:hypothetical protein BDV95DRAFT_486224 [Massariosphaeria phaeospora]|uniref:DUF7707 domain-containing protein n=1 Tax=Massariosphaeria phaeospora TaxID=100035 RepID=A0A7C8MR30_9PLEO|nr:hypothetical protein BDV95DRAFT_486224 [Massariosphaeria phaeospora]